MQKFKIYCLAVKLPRHPSLTLKQFEVHLKFKDLEFKEDLNRDDLGHDNRVHVYDQS